MLSTLRHTKSTSSKVLGVHAPPPQATLAGTFWLACVLSVPVAVLGVVAEVVLRVLL